MKTLLGPVKYAGEVLVLFRYNVQFKFDTATLDNEQLLFSLSPSSIKCTRHANNHVPDWRREMGEAPHFSRLAFRALVYS